MGLITGLLSKSFASSSNSDLYFKVLAGFLMGAGFFFLWP
jgi:hypothetical protein